MSRHRNRQERVPHGAAFPERPATATRAFEVTARQIDGLRDGAVDLLRVEIHQLRRSDRRAEYGEDGSRMEPARHDRRDEIGRHPLHDLIGGGDGSYVFRSRRGGDFSRGERGWDDRTARMGEHAEGVPLAAGEYGLGVD